jgi:hypothetical protein
VIAFDFAWYLTLAALVSRAGPSSAPAWAAGSSS